MTDTSLLRGPSGLLAGLGGVALGVAVLVPIRSNLDPGVPALVLVLPVLAGGTIGGRRPAVVTSVASAVAMNLFFLPPYNTFRIALWTDTIALGAFLAVALTVGALSAQLAGGQLAAQRKAEEMDAMHAGLEAMDLERQRYAQEAARNRVLEEVAEQRSALLRSVSHDLRTPLATIRAIASDLRSGTEYDEVEQAELLGIVDEEAERLDRLVSNLLSLSRIEAGAWKPTRRAVDLGELVRERISRLRRLFRQVRLEVDIPDDLPLVNGDYTQIEQVMTNLLENASRHAPPTSAVVVSATALGREWIRLSVEDAGLGVSDHERRRLFEPFQRGQSSQGTGIGLAICKAIVEAHGGTIDVERTPGGGATFVVDLPAWTSDRPH